MLGLVRGAFRAAARDHLLDWSAALAFYFLFALFPTILVVAALLAPLHRQLLVQNLVASLGRTLPPHAYRELAAALARPLRRHVPGLFSLGLLLLLYASAQGFSGLMAALNAAYEVAETRSWLRRTLVAWGLTFGAAAFMAAALALLLLGQRGLALGASRDFPLLLGRTGVFFRLTLIAALLWLAVRLLYRFAPNLRRQPRGAFAAAGLAVALLFLASAGLAWYSSAIGEYNAVYGSLGAVIILMLWLYLAALSLLLGAELHHQWLKQHGLA